MEAPTKEIVTRQLDVPKTTYVTEPLYHGAKKPFRFDAKYDFQDPDLDGSLTLGTGLYLTDTADDAANYSIVRRSENTPAPVVYVVRCPELKFLDFRGNDWNSMVPDKMLKLWLDYVSAYLQEEIALKPNVGDFLNSSQSDTQGSISGWKKINVDRLMRDDWLQYRDFLLQLQKYSSIDLRVLLGTAPPIGISTEFTPLGAPPWADLFRRFVTEELKYDGIIYMETGEGEKAKDHATFVVYNLEKVQFPEQPFKASLLKIFIGE